MGGLRYLTAGESHGPALTVVVEGLPARLAVGAADIEGELERRRRGYGRGARMKLERDEFEILGGVRRGLTLGGPVAVIVRNTEYTDAANNWTTVMAVGDTGDDVRRETRPRPGHADLAGMMKYDTRDARDILERASARETAARTVAGVFAKALLGVIGVTVVSHVVAIAGVEADAGVPTPDDFERLESSPCRCLDADAESRMIAAMDAAKDAGDTVGGVFEVIAYGVPAGLGSHVHWDRKLDGRLAQALMSIQAMKGVEIGDGFRTAATPGSAAHDEIFLDESTGAIVRRTNRAGGIEGGMSTGGPLRVRLAVKPFSTLRKALQTVDVDSREAARAIVERSDVCAVPSACPIGEAVVALTLADAALERFGGDTVEDFRAAAERARERMRSL